MNYLPKELTRELRKKFAIINNNGNYGVLIKCRKIASRRIAKNAQVHSYRMENPNLIVPYSVPRNTKRKYIKNGIKNIENAFIWGIQHFNPDHFDESFIREIAGRITPELYDRRIAQYRETGVTITGASVTPPYPSKLITYEIPWFVESLQNQLSYGDITGKIEAAIFAHLHLARLHPFVDGNGRTARTLQDIILYNYRIPSPLIESGERHIYYECIDQAVLGWDEKKALSKNEISEGEKLFYNLIGGKINASFDRIKDNCKQI
jgi:Fic/DOC family